MPDRRVLALIACLGAGCRTHASTGPDAPERPLVDPLVDLPPGVQPHEAPMPATTLDTMISDAVARVRAGVPASGRLSVLLSVGAGEPAARAAELLRTQLAADPRIVFARVTSEHTAPSADAGSAGGHVHGVEFAIEPPPDLVLSVSEADGRYYFAARLPGGDPLGPPRDGWSWVVQGP